MTDIKQVAGRPATFSRDEAIRRAIDLFWSEGYLSVTARELASAMQIQRSSFYNTFGGKQAVFREALDAYARVTPDAAFELIGADEAVIPVIVSALRELCKVRAADEQARGCLVCNSVAELVGVDDDFGAELEKFIHHRVALMARLLKQAADKGEFEPVADIDEIARAFVSFLLGINVASKAIRGEAELWGICRTFLLGIGCEEQALS